MRYYELIRELKKDEIVIPGLNGETVKNKDDFFKTGESGPNKFYDQDYEFDYLMTKAFGKIEKEGEVIADYHMWRGYEPSGGSFLPISKSFKEVLEQFKLSPSKFYKAKVLFEDKYHPYFIWQILVDEYQQYIDFEQSEFNNLTQSRKLRQEELKVKKFKSIEEVETKAKEDWGYRWNYERLVLKPEFRELDFCLLPVLHTVVSERLKEAIEKAGLTGIAFKELPITLEFSDEI